MQFIFKCASDINKCSINSRLFQVKRYNLPFTSYRLGGRIITVCCCHQIFIVSKEDFVFCPKTNLFGVNVAARSEMNIWWKENRVRMGHLEPQKSLSSKTLSLCFTSSLNGHFPEGYYCGIHYWVKQGRHSFLNQQTVRQPPFYMA